MKTAFKRVALVAAAALAIGGFSAVAANAAQSLTVAATGISGSNSGGYTLSQTTGTYASLTVTGTADHSITVSSAGAGTIYFPGTAPTGTLLSGGLWYAGSTVPGASTFTAAVAGTLTVSAYSATAGTQTISLVGDVGGTTTVTITWGAAPAASAANSIVATNNATDIAIATPYVAGPPAVAGYKATVATEDTGLTGVNTVNTLAGGAYVLVNNNASTPVAFSSDVISASVSGPGILKIGTTYAAAAAAAGGRSVSNAAAGSTAFVLDYSDGTSGTSTVTVTDSTAGIVLGTFTVTFYSQTIAKLAATTEYSVATGAVAGFTATPTEGVSGSVSTTVGAPVEVIATDANGNKIPGGVAGAPTINVSSGTTTVANVAATASYDSTNGYWFPQITPVGEGKTVLTFTDASTGLVVATATVWVLSPVVATLTAAADNSTYDPGTKVVYTLTAADAAGNPVADGAYSDLIATAATSNVGLQGTIPAASTVLAKTTFLGGVNSSTLYAPLATANVAIAGGVLGTGADVATALQGATINEVDFSTTGSSDNAANAATDAANEATDAANAATDAANAAADSADAATQAAQDAGDKADAALAAVTALSQQVTTLLAKVAALSATIAKIAKKLKA